MALEIFKLFGSIMVDNEAANESIQKTDEKANNLGKSLLSGVEKAAKFGTAVLGAATAAAGGVVALTKSTSESADAIDKASIRMGIDTTTYQKYAYAAGQCGVETTALEKAAKKLEGTDLNLDDAISQIMELGTEEERTAAAIDLFGENIAYGLAPILAQSGEDFDALKDRAEDLGLIMSEDAVKAGVELGDTMADVQASMEALGAQLGSALMPLVQDVIYLILDNMPLIQETMATLIPVIVSLAETLLPPLMELAQQLLPVLVDLINQLMPIISSLMATVLPVIVDLIGMLAPFLVQILETMLPIINSVLTPLLPLLEPIVGFLQPILDVLILFLQPLTDLLNLILPPLMEILGAFIGVLAEDLGICIEAARIWISETLVPAFQALWDKVTDVKDGVLTAWQSISDGIGGFVDGIKTKVQTGFDALVDIVKTPINTVIGFINKLIDGLNSLEIDVPDWVTDMTGIDDFSLNIPKIPELAKGGSIDLGGSAIVGEAGAELVDLPAGAKVTPLSRSNGEGGSVEDKIDAMVGLLQELIEIMPDAVAEGVSKLDFRWNNRELGRLVKQYE